MSNSSLPTTWKGATPDRGAMPSPPTMSPRSSGRSGWSRRARRAAGSSRCRSAARRIAKPPRLTLTIGGKPDRARAGQGRRAAARASPPRSRELSAGFVFVGYGLKDPRYGFDDYRGLDVRGKIVVALAGTPDRACRATSPPISMRSKDRCRRRGRRDRLCRSCRATTARRATRSGRPRRRAR